MADDPTIGQDEIENLLRQAQAEASGAAPPAATPASPSPALANVTAAGRNDALQQDEIEALLQSGGKTAQAAPAAPKPAAASAKTASKGAEYDDIAKGDIELLLHQAEAALASINEPAETPPNVKPFRLADFTGARPSAERTTLELIRDVELDLKIELGRTHMPLDEVLRLRKGSVVPLEKLAGDPVDIFVNGRLIARGEVLVLNDNFCVRVAELIAGEAA
jgi:flagellar motor switch protein FliN/FliY